MQLEYQHNCTYIPWTCISVIGSTPALPRGFPESERSEIILNLDIHHQKCCPLDPSLAHSNALRQVICIFAVFYFCFVLIQLQAVRRYASAAPTAAFAGQKGSNVCSSLPGFMFAIYSKFSRENIPSLLSLEMVRELRIFYQLALSFQKVLAPKLAKQSRISIRRLVYVWFNRYISLLTHSVLSTGAYSVGGSRCHTYIERRKDCYS